MCEQTPLDFGSGDIVWVKLGSCWWPGEVQDLEKLPEEWLADFKKRPLAAVKFFDEDKYEYVRSIDKIYSYNCIKKNEFIKKGLDLHRANHSFMKKFPDDISTAETKTNGDPNILGQSIFTPEKKTNFAALLFDSTPKGKKMGKRPRKSSSKSVSPKQRFSETVGKITHPRFTGHDDHEVRILVQSRHGEESASQEDPMYDCRSCSFKTSRIDVIILHNKSHIHGNYSTATSTPRKLKRGTGVRKLKMTKSKTSSIMEDLAMIERGLLVNTESSDDESLEDWTDPAPKKKRRKAKPRVKKPQVKRENIPKIDIRNNLLAEWEDDSDADTVLLNMSSNTLAGSDVSLNQGPTPEGSPVPPTKKTDAIQLDKSCFDFEEENEDNGIVDPPTGRKIPRVIPHSNKPKIVDSENDILISSEIKPEEENSNKEETDKYEDPDIEAFRDILDVTVVPELPAVPHLLKCEQNFHSAKTVKFPDKVNTSTSKSNIDDKRDSLPQNEVDDDISIKGNDTNLKVHTISKDEDEFKIGSIPQDILEPQGEKIPDESTNKVAHNAESFSKRATIEPVVRPLVEELTDALCKQDIELEIAPLSDAHKITLVNQKTVVSEEPTTTKLLTEKFIKIPDKDTVESTPKIINPKKRFVKSFEDFEQQLCNDSKKQMENEPLDSPIETSSVVHDKNFVEVSKLKTQLKNKLDSHDKLPNTNSTETCEVKNDSNSKPPRKIRKVEKENRSALTYESISREVLRIESELKEDRITDTIDIETSASDNLSQKSPVESVEQMDVDAFEKSEHLNIEDEMQFIHKDSSDEAVPDLDKIVQEEQDGVLTEGKVEESCESSTSSFCVQSDANEESQSTVTDDLSALSTLAAVSELTTNLDLQSGTIDVNSSIMEESSILNISEHQDAESVLSNDLVLHSEKIDENPVVAISTTPVVEDDIVRRSVSSIEIGEKNVIRQSRTNELDILTASIDSPPPSKYGKFAIGNLSKVVKTDKKQASSSVESVSLKSDKLQLHSKKVDIKSLTVFNKSGARITPELDTKYPKFVTVAKKSLSPIGRASNKPIILSEKVIKPISETETVSVQKVSSNRVSQSDFEDIDTFIIQKSKSVPVPEISDIGNNSSNSFIKKHATPRGKAKILQQTIIKPTGDIVKPQDTSLSNCIDDNVFDINSMPIVLDDQIFTTESIENMPVVLSDTLAPPSNKTTFAPASPSKAQNKQVKLLNKSNLLPSQPVLMKTYTSQKLIKSSKVFQTVPKNTKVAPSIIAKPKNEKFIIVSSINSTTPTTSKYTVGKRPLIKKTSVVSTTINSPKVQQNPEPTGNKIMIVTNQQGQQSRVLLTPTQQKLLGYQTARTKLVRSTLKNNILLKSNSRTTSPSGLLSTTRPLTTGGAPSSGLISSEHVVVSSKPQQTRICKVDPTKFDKKLPSTTQKILFQDGSTTLKGQQKTIVLKNQGQIVKKLQGSDDALLEQQVAEKVQAIKASGSFTSVKTKQELEASKAKSALRRSYSKKIMHTQLLSKSLAQATNSTTTSNSQKSESLMPPLAPISPKKSENVASRIDEAINESLGVTSKQDQVQQKPLNQLIIQDASGNQTTITEGQILALPSGDTVDGQPQSYMLVTLDESGNLAPLNNEALLSLDPNLCLGGDLSNVVLQIDGDSATTKQDVTDNSVTDTAEDKSLPSVSFNVNNDIVEEQVASPIIEASPPTLLDTMPTTIADQSPDTLIKSSSFEGSGQDFNSVQAVCNIANDSNRQLIITGDPESTQKFIESLTEGNQDLANLLATAEGSIIIQTDEQQILIKPDSKSAEQSNPVYSGSCNKSQDILAAALADTDVFQLDHKTRSKITPSSQLSPGGGLYPSSVTNLLDTTLSLSSPIMTPLEVPSSNNKKILDQETDVLTPEVPKNVDLPITITDPNISQTVSQQQVASLLMNELTSNLELPLTVVERPESVEISSSYVYSLPTLDEPTNTCSKTFGGSISMPLLNEDSPAINMEESLGTKEVLDENEEVPTSLEDGKNLLHTIDSGVSRLTQNRKLFSSSSFLDAISSEGLCTLGGAICSSLSEPPHDMFDLALVSNTYSRECEVETTNVDLSPHEADPVECDKRDTNNEAEIDKEETIATNCDVDTELTPPSVNLDENSCEIPVQPQIITDLGTTFETLNESLGSNKRSSSGDGIENEKKKSKFD